MTPGEAAHMKTSVGLTPCTAAVRFTMSRCTASAPWKRTGPSHTGSVARGPAVASPAAVAGWSCRSLGSQACVDRPPNPARRLYYYRLAHRTTDAVVHGRGVDDLAGDLGVHHGEQFVRAWKAARVGRQNAIGAALHRTNPPFFTILLASANYHCQCTPTGSPSRNSRTR